MILYSVVKLLLEFSSFAVFNLFCGLLLTISWKRAWLFRLKTSADFHSSVNFLLLFICYSYY